MQWVKWSVLAASNICFLKTIDCIEVQKYLFAINGLNNWNYLASTLQRCQLLKKVRFLRLKACKTHTSKVFGKIERKLFFL